MVCSLEDLHAAAPYRVEDVCREKNNDRGMQMEAFTYTLKGKRRLQSKATRTKTIWKLRLVLRIIARLREKWFLKKHTKMSFIALKL